jgi:hypothetical protein
MPSAASGSALSPHRKGQRGHNWAERRDAVDRAGRDGFRRIRSSEPSRQLILGVRQCATHGDMALGEPSRVGGIPHRCIGGLGHVCSTCIDLWFDMGACAREGSTVEAWASFLLHTFKLRLT